jgi:hypothetical protein
MVAQRLVTANLLCGSGEAYDRGVCRKIPVFVRFSTVASSRGSADTARDVRGFAVKMYTPKGNRDLVGNNIPVFFIQDARSRYQRGAGDAKRAQGREGSE